MHLLDTNVVSELRRPERANPGVLAWARSKPAHQFYISVITIMELEIGIRRAERADVSQGRTLRTWLESQVMPQFEGRIMAIDLRVAQLCAAMHVPDKKSDRDALIAATAQAHGFQVITRNVSDFHATGIQIVNPWV